MTKNKKIKAIHYGKLIRNAMVDEVHAIAEKYGFYFRR
jgi:hypothetical protein